jgi:tetratricopeptide (TPR) repeat protein
MEEPAISIRRRMAGRLSSTAPRAIHPQACLNILFVVSRPEQSPFLDPRADVNAVLDAIQTQAPGSFKWELLRPATLVSLAERLADKTRPAVDILHFDGHGLFEANTGYLLFEREDGGIDRVSAEQLSQTLKDHQVTMAILSACQSAALGDGEEPLGCIAARLTAHGLPAVLAMTHSVLMQATRLLFREFYQALAGGCGVSAALDRARCYLRAHPERYEVQRGGTRVWLRLQDWFVPALYQTEADLRLLKPSSGVQKPSDVLPRTPRSNIPAAPHAGFFGRRRELFFIERWFAATTRRITIIGFGGQGKTALAEESARWLLRIGMFQAAVLVDFGRMQGPDAVGIAVSSISSVLEESLIDAEHAAAALRKTPTLVILDNVEDLTGEPLQELLDASCAWSEAGHSRLILTTRRLHSEHSGFDLESEPEHRPLMLGGLGNRHTPADALDWFAELMKVPPAPQIPIPQRADIIALFDKVCFHPLSIRILAAQLKTRLPEELGQRLEGLLSASTRSVESNTSVDDLASPELAASLEMSLDQLDVEAKEIVPRLSVFRGGAFEDTVLNILKIRDDRYPFAEWNSPIWHNLRQQLQDAALIEVEEIPDALHLFIRFHPAIALVFWQRMGEEERSKLVKDFWFRYMVLADLLVSDDLDDAYEARAVAWQELPNLLAAVQILINNNDMNAGYFAVRVSYFLSLFGLKQYANELSAQGCAAAKLGKLSAKGDKTPQAMFQGDLHEGEQLLKSGESAAAVSIFQQALNYDNVSLNVDRPRVYLRLARCFNMNGKFDLAFDALRSGLKLITQIAQDDEACDLHSALHTDLADTFASMGDFVKAQQHYLEALTIAKSSSNAQSQGTIAAQRGMLALLQGQLEDSIQHYQTARTIFQQLREEASEAATWHQLGLAYGKFRQWDEAERHLRRAAIIREELGDTMTLTQTWHELALLNHNLGRAEAAEQWYQKALSRLRTAQDQASLVKGLTNFADLLQSQLNRPLEGHHLAEEALTIALTIDPNSAELWRVYMVLAEVADKQTDYQKAKEYQRKARDAFSESSNANYAVMKSLSIALRARVPSRDENLLKNLEIVLPYLEPSEILILVKEIEAIASKVDLHFAVFASSLFGSKIWRKTILEISSRIMNRFKPSTKPYKNKWIVDVMVENGFFDLKSLKVLFRVIYPHSGSMITSIRREPRFHSPAHRGIVKFMASEQWRKFWEPS